MVMHENDEELYDKENEIEEEHRKEMNDEELENEINNGLVQRDE